jgi:integrase
VPPPKPKPLHIPPLTCEPFRPPTKREPFWWWRGSYTVDGRTKRISLQRGDELTISTRAGEAIKKGLPGRGAKAAPPPAKVATVRQLLGTWKAHQRKRLEAEQIEAHTFETYAASVRRLANAASPHQIGDVALEDVTETTLEAHMLARAADGGAARSVNNDVGVFLMAWKWGRKGKLGPAGELEPTRLKPKPKHPTRTPNRDEILTLITVLPPRYALLVQLMYATGARVGEIAALEWADVDLDRRALRLGIHPGARKTGERTAAVVPEVIDALRAWAARPPEKPPHGVAPPPEVRDRWVLGTTPSSAVSRMSRLMKPACLAVAERLRLDPEASRITSHALRRWCATEMGRAGVSVKTAAAQQGHTEEMNLAYQRPTLDDQAEAVARARLGVVRGDRI